MKFVDDVKAFLEENPDNVMDIPGEFDCRMVETEIHDESRWHNVYHSVFEKTFVERNLDGHNMGQYKEYVLVEHCEPATEEQEGGDFPAPEVFAVEPYVVEVVKYRPC